MQPRTAFSFLALVFALAPISGPAQPLQPGAVRSDDTRLALLANPPRSLKPEDFAAIREVGDPQLSPDGAWVVYTVGTIDLAANKSAANLWLASYDGTTSRQLTFGDKVQVRPRWSPDGHTIAFLSSRGDAHENSQLWFLPRDGGEAVKVTEGRGDIEDFAWAPDSRRLVLVIRDPDPNAAAGKDEKKTPPPIVIDRYQFKQDEIGYLTDRYAHLELLDLANGKLTPLTSGAHDDVLPAWSPDGRTIAFVTKRGDDPDRTENWDIYLIAAEPGAHERQLTTSPEADAHPDWWESAPVWSPDSQWVAYLHGADPKKIEYAANTLAIIPAAGGAARILTPTLDRNLREPRFTPDGKSVLALVEDDGGQNLVRFPVDGAAPGPLTNGLQKIRAFDLGADGHVVALESTPERPYEVYAVEPYGKLRPITRQNHAFLAEVGLAPVEPTVFHSADGTEIHGFIVHPFTPSSLVPMTAGVAPPALLRPHGGPQAQYAAEFNFEAQLFAAHGYSVILPNPRGSTGRGTAFSLAISGAWGSVDVQDDLAAVDDAIKRGLADPNRLGVGGWSYGGMSTNYLIASTTRFKAATSGASISNILAGYGTDEYIRDYENELGSPWRNPDAWMRISYPFYHADRIKTPTLFLCGQADFNVPLLNSEQMYQALRTLGVPSKLVIYPGQYHRFTKPSYILDRYRRYLAWYAKWLGSGKIPDR